MGWLTNEFASIRYATLTLNKVSTCRIQDQQLKQLIPLTLHSTCSWITFLCPKVTRLLRVSLTSLWCWVIVTIQDMSQAIISSMLITRSMQASRIVGDDNNNQKESIMELRCQQVKMMLDEGRTSNQPEVWKSTTTGQSNYRIVGKCGRGKVWQISRSAKRFLIVSTNLDGLVWRITDDWPNSPNFPRPNFPAIQCWTAQRKATNKANLLNQHFLITDWPQATRLLLPHRSGYNQLCEFCLF